MGTMREGEIVQVQGGHIIRATGRKDRHSKVYTAKGPRDRRVRLSAHTAIQFYDVQDRLGYDRPSKAVDWLMNKAKSAIDKLAQLPPFDPAADPPDLANGDNSESSRYEIGQFQPATAGLVSQPMEESMKSFFPSTSAAVSPMGFHGYPHQDLCLSLQSFQNPGLVHGQSDPGNPNSNHPLFPVGFETGTSSGGGGGGSWPAEANLAEMGQFSRLLAWNGGGGVVGYGGVGERETQTLHSSFHHPPSIRAWDDLSMGNTTADQHHRIPKLEAAQQQQQAAMAGIGVLGSDGFMGFCVPAQMQGGGGGGGEDVHGINLSYRHNSTSSMSTDSSR